MEADRMGTCGLARPSWRERQVSSRSEGAHRNVPSAPDEKMSARSTEHPYRIHHGWMPRWPGFRAKKDALAFYKRFYAANNASWRDRRVNPGEVKAWRRPSASARQPQTARVCDRRRPSNGGTTCRLKTRGRHAAVRRTISRRPWHGTAGEAEALYP